MKTGQRQQIYELLLIPIVCDDRKRKNLERVDDVVYTGQKYASTYVDEDMLDYAVGFYEILYKKLAFRCLLWVTLEKRVSFR